MSAEKRKPFSESKVGKFLKERLPDVVESVGDIFPPAKILTALVGEKLSPEEKAQFDKLILEYEQIERKDYLADSANARDHDARIQESDKASWMAKNMAYVFDSVIIVAFIVMLFVIFYRAVPETNKELFYTGFGLLGSLVTQTISFHRGSSKGSEDKHRMLTKLLK